jgi:hypothetical protein
VSPAADDEGGSLVRVSEILHDDVGASTVHLSAILMDQMGLISDDILELSPTNMTL